MRAYSTDLRERIVSAVERGKGSLRELADLFLVSLATIVRLLRRYRADGTLLPKPHAGGRCSLLDAEACQRLRDLVAAQPDATLAELRQRLGIPCGLSTLCRTLQRLRLSRKKKSLHADEQDTPAVQAERAAFEDRMATVDPAHLVFVDEMGANTAMTRTYGRGPIGERVVGSAPGKWDNVTLIAGLRSTEMVAPFAFAGATDQEAFQTYVEQVLVPALRPGDVVVWDNLNLHKNRAAVAAVQAAQARVEPLPVYSPDESPIEEMFSKAKTYLRKVAARTVDTVIPALGEALNLVTPKDCLGWFHDRAAYAYAFH